VSTSAISRAIILLLCLTIYGCGSTPQQTTAENYPEPVFRADRLLSQDFLNPQEVNDPWRSMNTRIYNFNYHFDQKVFLPTVHGYRAVVPQFARTGVSNFFNNFRDVRTMANSLLQLSPEKFFESTGRVFANTTFGIFGLIDVATMMDIPRPDEDFGQTLGHWGVGQGPYLVIPLLGPSNLRDGAGMLPDLYLQNVIQDDLLSKPLRSTVFLLDSINTRNNTSFRYYETGSAYEYDMVRWLWSTKRKLDVAK
jgi:phospholipid-binding lipoprotein MlaA